jgi:8-oxo-dGTP pyrophosphatase MutT (NUDIX family)
VPEERQEHGDQQAPATQFERWARQQREGAPEGAEVIPAATVVLVREADGSLETLMLRKNSKLAFGGMWVFPGGRIDEADHAGAADVEAAARAAAVREAMEEADLAVDPGSLAWISHWLPPRVAPKKFATWFFVAPAPEGAVTIDMGEIHEEEWMRPSDALARRDALEIELAPPTWMTLHYLSGFAAVDALMADAHARTPVFYETTFAKSGDVIVAMWEGDAGYEASDPEVPGPRHRIVMTRDGPWVLDRTV